MNEKIKHRLSSVLGRHTHHVRDGLVVIISHLTHQKSSEEVTTGEDAIKFHFRYSGLSDLGRVSAPDARLPVETMSCGALVQPAGLRKVEYCIAGEKERSVTLICTPEFLDKTLTTSVTRLPRPIYNMITGRSPDFEQLMMLMRPAMARDVKHLTDLAQDALLHDLEVEAKSMSLFCQIIRLLSDVSNSPAPSLCKGRNRDRVIEICAIMDERYASPPSIANLAKHLAWNESQLMEVFRRITGKTVYEYRHDVQMREALKRVLETQASFTEIAFDIGYEYPSNFSTAFKRYFSIPPKQARAAASPNLLHHVLKQENWV